MTHTPIEETMPNFATHLPVVMCVAGFDPSGGGGLLADARAVRANGGFAVCVQTALVPQNTRGVREIAANSPALVSAQIEALLDDFSIAAVKIGLMPNVEVLEVVVNAVTNSVRSQQIPVVVDPVLAPTSGPIFSDATTVELLKSQLLPLATVVTPNAPEAAILSGLEARNFGQMPAVAHEVWKATGANAVWLKGGHIAGENEIVDVIFDGKNSVELRAPRIEGEEVRGTGCLLASALAARLAGRANLLESAQNARSWLQNELEIAQKLGKGRRIAVGSS